MNYPALDEDDNALALELIPAEQLIETRRQVSPATWQALYQGNPVPDEGILFKAEGENLYDGFPRWDEATRQWFIGDLPLRIYASSDWALSPHADADWTVHLIVGMDHHGVLWAFDLWRQQASPEVSAEAMLDLYQKWQPVVWAEENSVVEKGIGPLVLRMAHERGLYGMNRQGFSSARDKVTKTQPIIGLWNMGRVRLPREAPWTPGMVHELLRFDRGRWDDQVDAWGLQGRIIAGMSGGTVPHVQLDEPPGPGVVVKLHPDQEDVPGARQITYDEMFTAQRRWDRRDRRRGGLAL